MTNTFDPATTNLAQTRIGLPHGSRVVVVGAGAFGGWTSLYLLRSGFKVTLVDAFGPGNSRSSSGDETRVIRSTYGANEFYFKLNVRALELWKEAEKAWNKSLFFNRGVLWFCYDEKSPLIDDSIPYSIKYNAPYEHISKTDLAKRYPAVNISDLHHAWFDPHGGYLKARESCQAVNEAFIREGGTYIQALAKPGKITSGNMTELTLSNGEKLSADFFL